MYYNLRDISDMKSRVYHYLTELKTLITSTDILKLNLITLVTGTINSKTNLITLSQWKLNITIYTPTLF